MDVFKAINTRRNVRSYTKEAVTDEELNSLLEAAVRAPSAGNRQTWRFVVVRNPETIEKMYRSASYSSHKQTFVKKAALVIVVCANTDIYKRSSVAYRERGINLFCIQDTAAATQNLLLAAHAMGLGACWVSLFDEEQVRDTLNLPDGVRPLVLIPTGHTNSKAKPGPRKPLNEVIIYESY